MVTELLELRAGKVEPLLTEVTKVRYRPELAESTLLVLAVVDELREAVHRHFTPVTGAKVAGNFDNNLVVELGHCVITWRKEE